MNMTIYEEATWYDIENNKMHLKKDGEHYVADAMLLRDNLNLRQENERLKKENDSLRKEINSTERLQAENAKLKRKLEILKDYGIEIVDAVAGGFEIYNEEHARADKLQAENEKLRKLVDAVKEFVEDTHCEDCPFRRDCDDNNRIFCADDFSYHAFAAMREQRIEVNNG